MNRINWLASYPKSGNTWVRAFLSAYLTDTPVDINDMQGVRSDQSKFFYDPAVWFPLDEMPPDVQLLMRPTALVRIAYSVPCASGPNMRYPLILKSHQINAMVAGVRLIPPQLTEKVVYLVRDPRGVAVSYSKHYGMDLDTTIDHMLMDDVEIYDEGKESIKAHSYLSGWMRHVKSYAYATDLNVKLVRFEDLKLYTTSIFRSILEWYNIPVDEARLIRAEASCRLSELRKQEDKKGFSEASNKADRFFNDGKMGDWGLSPAQEDRLIEGCGDMMAALNYIETAKQAAHF